MLKRFFSNAAANAFSGGMAAAYQLVVAALAVATWLGADFAAWGLAMSIAAIAPILSASLSSVVTRRLVEARHRGPDVIEAAIVLAGRRISWGLAGIAFATLFLAGALIQGSSDLGALSTGEFLVLLTIMLSTNAWLLLWQVRFGQHYADELNWLPALTLAIARAGGVVGMIGALALGSRNLTVVALGLAAGTWIALLAAQLVLPSPRRIGGASLPTPLEVRNQLRLNLRVQFGFAIGSASSLIVQYSIPPLIALIAPQHFNAFYLASTVNVVVVGLLSAAMLALLAPFTRWHAIGASQGVQRIALFSPALCAGLSLAVLYACWFMLEIIPDALTTQTADIADVQVFLALLGLQTIVRTSAMGFATIVAAAGTSRQMGIPLMIEMLLAFTVAVPLGWLFGVQGLMLGLTLAALVGSQFSSRPFTLLFMPAGTPARAAFASLLAAQLIGSAIWWLIVGPAALNTALL